MVDIEKIIVDAIVGGAAATASGLASDAVKSAYGAIKELIGAKFSMWNQIEEKPASPGYRLIAEEELGQYASALSTDTVLMERLCVLQDALSLLDGERARKAQIDIARIRAGRDAIIEGLKADKISIAEVVANQDVRIANIDAGNTRKN